MWLPSPPSLWYVADITNQSLMTFVFTEPILGLESHSFFQPYSQQLLLGAGLLIPVLLFLLTNYYYYYNVCCAHMYGHIA